MFDLIKRKHGTYASWAVWAEPTAGPKSNIGDLRVLDPDLNPDLLKMLCNDVVMLGLNVSRFLPPLLGNFHDRSPAGQDFKIRFAFAGTRYYGAYMTDLIKEVVMLASGDLVRYLAETPSVVGENVKRLLAEFEDLGSPAPIVIAFGRDAYRLAKQNLPSSRYSRLVGVTHYSHYISKEAYRDRVLTELGA